VSPIQIIALVLTCAAAAVSVASAVTAYQANQLTRRAREHTLPIHTVESGEVCSAYRVPRTSADSGLCACCGMFDYKHQEQQ
jgi:hypothetical protein